MEATFTNSLMTQKERSMRDRRHLGQAWEEADILKYDGKKFQGESGPCTLIDESDLQFEQLKEKIEGKVDGMTRSGLKCQLSLIRA